MRDATYLAKKLALPQAEINLIQVAACLHDFGFTISRQDHEYYSCREAKSILPKFDFANGDIEMVCKMIRATHLPQKPNNTFEKILCDADLFYLGCTYYFEIAERFKQELKELNLFKSEAKWRELQIEFLTNHSYHLDISKNLLNQNKLNVLNILKNYK